MDFPEKQNEYHFRLDNFRSVVVTSDQFDANVEAYGRLNKASEIRKDRHVTVDYEKYHVDSMSYWSNSEEFRGGKCRLKFPFQFSLQFFNLLRRRHVLS